MFGFNNKIDALRREIIDLKANQTIKDFTDHAHSVSDASTLSAVMNINKQVESVSDKVDMIIDYLGVEIVDQDSRVIKKIDNDVSKNVSTS